MRALLCLGLLSRLVLTQCELDIALNPRNWTISDSAENPIVLFCNRWSTQAACVQPLLPNHITTWLVLGRAQPGHAEMRFDFPHECFPYVGFDLELLNIFTVADGLEHAYQNATVLILMNFGTYYWPFSEPSNSTNATYSETPATSNPAPITSQSLRLIVKIHDTAENHVSRLIIGGVVLRLF